MTWRRLNVWRTRRVRRRVSLFRGTKCRRWHERRWRMVITRMIWHGWPWRRNISLVWRTECGRRHDRRSIGSLLHRWRHRLRCRRAWWTKRRWWYEGWRRRRWLRCLLCWRRLICRFRRNTVLRHIGWRHIDLNFWRRLTFFSSGPWTEWQERRIVRWCQESLRRRYAQHRGRVAFARYRRRSLRVSAQDRRTIVVDVTVNLDGTTKLKSGAWTGPRPAGEDVVWRCLIDRLQQ